MLVWCSFFVLWWCGGVCCQPIHSPSLACVQICASTVLCTRAGWRVEGEMLTAPEVSFARFVEFVHQLKS